MDGVRLLIPIILLRHFTPMTTLVTAYLIKEKGISNKYIHTNLYIIFFITSLLTFPLTLLLSYHLKSITFVFTSNALQFLYYILLIESNTKELGKFLLNVSVVFHGIATSLFSSIRPIIFKSVEYYNNLDSNKEKINIGEFYRKSTFYKKLSKIIGSLISQTIYNITDFPPIMFLTLISLLVGIILSLFLTNVKFSEVTLNNLFKIQTYKKIFTKEIFYLSCINIIESSLTLAFSIYSSNIFIDRKQELPDNVLRFLEIVAKPLKFLILIYLNFFKKFYSIKIQEIKSDTILFGYIDAISSVSSMLFSYIYSIFFNRYIDKNINNILPQKISYIFLIIVLIAITFSISKVESLLATYLLFIVGLTVTNSLTITLHPLAARLCPSDYRTVLFTLLSFICSLIHTAVSIFGRKYNKAGGKILIYGVISCIFLILAIFSGFLL